MSPSVSLDPLAFIHANTRIVPVAGLEPIRLWQADEITSIWTATEADLEKHRMPPPFWAFPWAGGQALSRYVLANHAMVAGKRVLDLACGSGLIAIAAAMAGADARANDIDHMSKAATAANAELNSVSVSWVDGDLIQGPTPEIDIICAGDVFYEKPMAEAFLAWLTRAKADGVTVLVGDPGRSYFPSGLTQLAEYAIATTLEIESTTQKITRVWRL